MFAVSGAAARAFVNFPLNGRRGERLKCWGSMDENLDPARSPPYFFSDLRKWLDLHRVNSEKKKASRFFVSGRWMQTHCRMKVFSKMAYTRHLASDTSNSRRSSRGLFSLSLFSPHGGKDPLPPQCKSSSPRCRHRPKKEAKTDPA